MKFSQLNNVGRNCPILKNDLVKTNLDFKVKGYNIYGNETNCKNRRPQPWVVIFKRDHASPVIPNLIKFKH